MAAICVLNVNDQSVVRFTLVHTLCCVIHRRLSRVIHCLKFLFGNDVTESNDHYLITRQVYLGVPTLYINICDGYTIST